MTSSPSTYLLPGPSPLLAAKSLLPPMLHPRAPLLKPMPTGEPFHPLSSALLSTPNPNDDSGSGSNGHSLSQSMESINNIGLPDDEVNCFGYSSPPIDLFIFSPSRSRC